MAAERKSVPNSDLEQGLPTHGPSRAVPNIDQGLATETQKTKLTNCDKLWPGRAKGAIPESVTGQKTSRGGANPQKKTSSSKPWYEHLAGYVGWWRRVEKKEKGLKRGIEMREEVKTDEKSMSHTWWIRETS